MIRLNHEIFVIGEANGVLLALDGRVVRSRNDGELLLIHGHRSDTSRLSPSRWQHYQQKRASAHDYPLHTDLLDPKAGKLPSQPYV
jgi:hypothetical protein